MSVLIESCREQWRAACERSNAAERAVGLLKHPNSRYANDLRKLAAAHRAAARVYAAALDKAEKECPS